VRNAVKVQVLGALVLFSAGWWLAGCKAAPELTQTQALALIQADYDHAPGAPFDITVDDRGMQLGVHANYWLGSKRYPNGYWGDFTLTPEGKKAVKLPNGGDVIQWRPERPGDVHYAVVVASLAETHLKARDVGEIQNLGDNKTATFVEDVNLAGLPDALQNIAHQPGNKLSTQRVATFALAGDKWTVKSIE